MEVNCCFGFLHIVAIAFASYKHSTLVCRGFVMIIQVPTVSLVLEKHGMRIGRGRNSNPLPSTHAYDASQRDMRKCDSINVP